METSEFLTVGRREQFEQETTQVNRGFWQSNSFERLYEHGHEEM